MGHWHESQPTRGSCPWMNATWWLQEGSDPDCVRSLEERVEGYRRKLTEPYSLKSNRVEGEWNQPLPLDALPPTLEHVMLSPWFNQPLIAGALPSSLLTLSLGPSFDQPLHPGVFPSSLEYLAFGADFNQPLLPGVLPPSLLELDLGNGRFHQPLQPDSLPVGLKRLTMRGDFNHPLPPGVLPSSLTHLHLGASYRQPFQVGSLPNGLVQLYFGNGYNRPILPGVLPSSLRELHFVSHFNPRGVNEEGMSLFRQDILPGQLPSGLECLVLPHRYQGEVAVGALPAGLLVLDLGSWYLCSLHMARLAALGDWLPRGLRWLRMTREQHRGAQAVLPPDVQLLWYVAQLERDRGRGARS